MKTLSSFGRASVRIIFWYYSPLGILQEFSPQYYRQSTWLMISPFCSCGNYCLLELLVLAYWDEGRIPERPISINPGFKFCSVFVFYIPMYCLWQHFVFSGSIILKGSTVFCNLQLHVLRWENRAWIWLSWIKLNQLSRNRAHVSYRGDKRANNGPSKSSTKKEANQCFRREVRPFNWRLNTFI